VTTEQTRLLHNDHDKQLASSECLALHCS